MKYIGQATGGSVLWFEDDDGSHLIETATEGVDRFLGESERKPRLVDPRNYVHVSLRKGKLVAGIRVIDQEGIHGEVVINREDLIFALERNLMDGAPIELAPSMNKKLIEMLKEME